MTPPRPPRERFTMLEPKRPNNLTPEQMAWPLVPLADEPQRLTVLDPKPPSAEPAPDESVVQRQS